MARTWWIDNQIILGTSNPTDTDLAEFAVQGFDTIVCLLDPNEQTPNYSEKLLKTLAWTLHNLPMYDRHPPSVAQLQKFVSIIRGLKEGSKLVVHCQGGTGRTGTFAAAYWITKGLEPGEAVIKVRRLNPKAIDTDEQIAVLDEFAKSLQNSQY